MGRGGQRPPSPSLFTSLAAPPLRDEELVHYSVLEGAAYDLRKLGDRHPGGALALTFAGGRDLSRTWAGLHGFADPQKTRAWLARMRVKDKDLERRIVLRAKPDAYTSGETVTEHLARIERESLAFAALSKGGAAPQEPPQALVEGDLGAELGARVRWLFRRKATGGPLTAATKAPATYWPWLLLVFTSFVTSYVLWVRGSYLGLITLGPLGQLLAFAVMHDASHYAISTKRWVNTTLAYAGIAYTSPHEWTLQHVLGHHVAPNVEGEDPDVVHARRYMKALTGAGKAFDALLVWLVALPAAITLLAPLRVRKNAGVYPASTVHEGARSLLRHCAHFAGRAVHTLAFFVWPFLSPEYSVKGAFMWVLIPACSGSLVFMAVTQVAHLLEATITGPDEADRSWAAQQIANACDFAPDSPLVARLTGGLNRQVEHHLFPTVHHAHLPALALIVKDVTERRGLQHHVLPSATCALRDHLAFLRSMEDVPSGPFIVDGTVVHSRAKIATEPKHRFETAHTMWLLPLDDDEAMAPLQSGPISFLAADHLRSRPGVRNTPTDVADAVRALCGEHPKPTLKRVDSPDSVLNFSTDVADGDSVGVEAPAEDTSLGRVDLLTMPRTFGYVFNPISVYYVRDGDGRPAYVVFEVSNTPWLEEVLYVHPVHSEDTYVDVKKMHVSPFQPMGQTYTWTAPFPSSTVSLRVDVARDDTKYFVATFDGPMTQAPLSALGRFRAAVKLTPHIAVLGIHVHAALLLAKGAKFYPHPSGVKTAMSRCIEVIFHSRYRLFAYFLLRKVRAPSYLVATAAVGVLQRAASVLSRKSSSKSVTVKEASSKAPNSKKSEAPSESTPIVGLDAHLNGAAAGRRVAIIGSGVAGNGAAYLLRRRGVEVVVFEAEASPGGHAMTVEVEGSRVDVGFQVFNLANYPRLSKLFDDLNVQHVQSDMSLSVEGSGAAWSSTNPFVGCLTSPTKLWSRLTLLREILRFEKKAKALLEDDKDNAQSVNEWLVANNFSERLAKEYCEPMVGAIWSRTSGDVLDAFPMASVAQFLANHYMLDRSRPTWRTPRLRSQDYVQKLVRAVGSERYRLNSRVTRLHQKGDRWLVECDGPQSVQPFDAVILACDAPACAAILGDRAPELLKALKTTQNDVVVHRDAALMPSDKGAWAAWNCRPGGALTYWVNALQPGADAKDLFITLNSTQPVEALWRRTMAHPVLDANAQAWRAALPSLQGQGSVYFAGAWCGFGFHEDGLGSAYDAVDALCGTVTQVPPSVFAPTSRLAKGALKAVCRMSRSLARQTAAGPRPEIVVTLPEGIDLIAADAVSSSERVEVRIFDPKAAWRLLADPSMGLAEGYMEGSLDLKPSIRAVLHAALKCKGADAADSPQNVASRSLLTIAKRFTDVLKHALNANTRDGSLKNIAAHYDLSNAFYELWLDETLTYSAALFDEHEPYLRREGLLLDDGKRGLVEEDASDDVLAAAQIRKLDSLLDKAGVCDGDRVLEIGCGWGSLALRCVERFPSCQYVAITISKEQLAEASQRLEGKDQCRVVFCDYRDARETLGLFDKVVSCEMIEAVGHEFLPSYFRSIHACLKPGGSAALQVITVPDERYASYIKGSDFIRKHVFPGSSLVCLEAVKKALPALGSLALRLDEKSTLSMGLSYARTLRAWRVRFDAVEARVTQLGFDDGFVRKWRYYLDYCEAGFACDHIDVKQIRLVKTDEALAIEATEGAHGGRPLSIKDGCIRLVKGVATAAFERGHLPDFVTRIGIRQLSAQQLRHCDDAGRAANKGAEAGLAGSQEKLRETIQALIDAPVAVCTAEANEQHYEVDARFYGLCLGPHRKYSACFYEGAESKWPGNKLQRDAAKLLPKAEKDSLDQVAERADISQATKAILDVGCGWGSASLYFADRFRNAQVVGVSNSHSQRKYIMGQAAERGLTNLQIVTLDLSKEPLDKALEALQRRLPGQYFQRGSSIEMFEHMKNYRALFEKITAVLEENGRLFVHVFCHRQYAYHFVAKSDADWMAKYFFAGGTMPSADLFVHFAARKDAPIALVDHWRNSGVHYALTAEGWLQNMDNNADLVREILKEAYPPHETELWFNRWRAFYLACVELFGYDGGQEWCVGHYLFEKR